MEHARVVQFLRQQGAGERRHAHGRSLLEHLLGSAAILERWGQPDELVAAALVHSVYGTRAHPDVLLAEGERPRVAELVGPAAERLADLFGRIPPDLLLTGPGHDAARELDGLEPAPTRAELDALVVLHMANLADQARGPDRTPGRWLARLGQWVERLVASPTITLPRAAAGLLLIAPEDEEAIRSAYVRAVAADDLDGLALVAARAAILGEPCVRLAERLAQHGERRAARSWAAEGRRRLEEFGVAWDPGRSWDGWMAAARRVEFAPAASAAAPAPRAAPRLQWRREDGDQPDPSARFLHYVAGLSGPGGAAAGRVYPGLTARPWHDPDGFDIARALAENGPAIRRELLALDPAAFHPESERIERTGRWDVLFLYERGRRRDDVCERCPVTTEIIERPGTVRTLGGLIYVSRMRPGTHIAAHRGPTNLRLRCHLGIEVPDGDCAIRVGGETRGWTEGECLVFDDFLEHEAWNHTTAERWVLIVDLWHPDLTPAEVSWLEGLQRYALGHARGLERYWAANARAAAAGG